MHSQSTFACVKIAVIFATCVTPFVSARGESLSNYPVAVAVRNGDCKAAARLLNPVAVQNDKDTAFLGGRMLSEGICLEANPVGAAHFYAHAAELGDQRSKLEFATAIGRGEGADQSYEHAGEICRGAGIDPQSKLSPYDLGYACTVLGVAGKVLRTTLPQGAFVAGTGDASVRFNASTGEWKVLETPRVARGPAPLGSHMGKPLIDAEDEVSAAWKAALAKVPPPDHARLENVDVVLTLDLDMYLERGLDIAKSENAHFQPVFGATFVPR